MAKNMKLWHNINMTNTHSGSHFENPEILQDATARQLPNVVQGKVDQFGQRVIEVAGLQMDQAPPLTKSLNALTSSLPSPKHNSISPAKENSVLQNLEETLEEIERIASELIQKNMEHRLGDFRDMVPIWANVRSHKLATREGVIIDRLKREVAGLQALVDANHIPLDLTDLLHWTDKQSKPGGFGKALATIFLVRQFHRSLSTPRKEHLKEAASNLRAIVRDMVRGVQHRNAA
jgi:hypothetical protein